MSRKFKLNKAVYVFIALFLILTFSLAMKSKKGKIQPVRNSINNGYVDNSTGDNSSENLNALTAQLHKVMKSNEALQARNTQLQTRNRSILSNINKEVKKNLDSELTSRHVNNDAQISQLKSQLETIQASIQKAKESSFDGRYKIDGGTEVGVGQDIKVGGEQLVSVPDISGQHSSNNVANDPSTSKELKLNSAKNHSKNNQSSTPYYTIPSGATLASSVSMTSLIGRVPVDGAVKSPYPFKMMIGRNNMAANGLYIPGINGAIVQGYTVGDMSLSCVKGYITAITFIFPDGTISTTSINQSSNSSGLGFNNSLGYISEPNGNPCFPGKFYTNAPEYLATMISLGALNQGGQAYAMSQQTAMSNAFGGASSTLTGSIGKYMLGGAVQGGTKQAMDWYTQREKNSFDAVFVPAGRRAVINITKQIDINHNSKGRKIYYAHRKASFNNTTLD